MRNQNRRLEYDLNVDSQTSKKPVGNARTFISSPAAGKLGNVVAETLFPRGGQTRNIVSRFFTVQLDCSVFTSGGHSRVPPS
jgi:hypothetical protein